MPWVEISTKKQNGLRLPKWVEKTAAHRLLGRFFRGGQPLWFGKMPLIFAKVPTAVHDFYRADQDATGKIVEVDVLESVITLSKNDAVLALDKLLILLRKTVAARASIDVDPLPDGG